MRLTTIARVLRPAPFAGLLVLAIAAPAAAQEKVARVDQPLYGLKGSFWPHTEIPVCWDTWDRTQSQERGWVRSAIEATWERYTHLRFFGWLECAGFPHRENAIRITVSDAWPSTTALGTGLRGVEGGMLLNFTYNKWPGDDLCADGGAAPDGFPASGFASHREYCTRTIATHEFGHALGFAHEDWRSDRFGCDSADVTKQGTQGDYTITEYDLASVMNYCNPNWDGFGQLSFNDMWGVAAIYGGWSPWFGVRPGTRFKPGAPVSALVPRDGHVDLFAVSTDGVVRTSWWEEGPGWSEWFALHPETKFPDSASVTSLEPRDGHIDLFAVDHDGIVRTAWWEGATGWSQWYTLHPEVRFPPGATVSALVPRDGHIDLFAVDARGVARTAWWEASTGWSQWYELRPEVRFAPGASITALKPREGHIDLFAVSADGIARTAWWEAGPSWSEWYQMHPETRFPTNSHISALVPRDNHIDLFAVSADGVARTAWWEPGSNGFSQWYELHAETKFQPGASITALAPRPGHIDVFGVDVSGIVRTAYWEGAPGWSTWIPLHAETRLPTRRAPTPLAPRPLHIDLFATGNDNTLWSAWWWSR